MAPNAFVRESGTTNSGNSRDFGIAAMKQPAEPVAWVGGGKHPKLVAAGDQLAGKGVDVPVHAPRICP